MYGANPNQTPLPGTGKDHRHDHRERRKQSLSPQGITAPYWEPAARAEFVGMSDRTTRADLLRALYEGIALSIRDGYAVLPQPVSKIRLAGGGEAKIGSGSGLAVK